MACVKRAGGQMRNRRPTRCHEPVVVDLPRAQAGTYGFCCVVDVAFINNSMQTPSVHVSLAADCLTLLCVAARNSRIFRAATTVWPPRIKT